MASSYEPVLSRPSRGPMCAPNRPCRQTPGCRHRPTRPVKAPSRCGLSTRTSAAGWPHPRCGRRHRRRRWRLSCRRATAPGNRPRLCVRSTRQFHRAARASRTSPERRHPPRQGSQPRLWQRESIPPTLRTSIFLCSVSRFPLCDPAPSEPPTLVGGGCGELPPLTWEARYGKTGGQRSLP